MEFDQLSKQVIGCAIEVHRELGPGLQESTYEKCLAHELRGHNIECVNHSSFGVQNGENQFPPPHHSCSNRIVNVSN
ncbi:MAG: GxxExxY protein [gamma proteobacterium endosymbiont of Lamellibrachia anaximandri]|nr:GxxExxY protein [gamma proteobacterium endosymbiont of Lamellibrachia anaximandri]MBL3535802.1 GxxExxY protein [gamma proteobacterium endosymbiont of Lamellibrachia anaximandri]